ITLEKAQEIALAQANVNAADAVFDDKEFDHDDGTPIFELEFMANGNEYEYDIHAVTGKVVKAEHKTAGTQGGTPEIGRASCRERVKSGGGDGSVKEKEEEKKDRE